MKRQTTTRRNVALAAAISAVATVYAAGYVWLYQQAPVLSIVLACLQLSVIAAVVISGMLQREPAERTAVPSIDLRDDLGEPTPLEPAVDLDNVTSLEAARAQRRRRAQRQQASQV